MILKTQGNVDIGELSRSVRDQFKLIAEEELLKRNSKNSTSSLNPYEIGIRAIKNNQHTSINFVMQFSLTKFTISSGGKVCIS